jgi:ubiquinone/menaquinone biosynthesis C-methylase UbiE
MARPDSDADAAASRRDVRATYDRIADHFARTRQRPWPEVTEFVEAAPRAALALDLGCGNGRHAELLADRAERVMCADLSRGALATARDRAADRGYETELLAADAAGLPLRSGSVGLAVYVAAVHHLPTRALRLASLDELARVLTAEGVGLVSAWSTTHDRFDREEAFDAEIDWTLPGGETVGRFYHVYDPGSFERDLRASALSVTEAYESEGNCYARVTGDG